MSKKPNPPLGYKWVINYKCRDGKSGMGLTDNHVHLPSMIEVLLADGARDITIKDETFYKDD